MFLHDNISIITITIITACHPRQNATYTTHGTHFNTPPMPARYPCYTNQQTTHTSMPPMLAHHSRKHATHIIHVSTTSTRFLKVDSNQKEQVSLCMVSSFKNRHFVAKDLLKLNNTIKRLNIILYYSQSLSACECLIGQIYEQNCNRLKNHTHLEILLQTQLH